MSTFIEMTMEDWEKAYKPIFNHIDEHASFQDESGKGIMFETYGEEVEFVKSQNHDCIWTYVTGDNNSSLLVSGYAFVNRIGYFVTEIPCPQDTDITVILEAENYLCANCEEQYFEKVEELYEAYGDLGTDGKCPKCATDYEQEKIGWTL